MREGLSDILEGIDERTVEQLSEPKRKLIRFLKGICIDAAKEKKMEAVPAAPTDNSASVPVSLSIKEKQAL